MVNQRHIKTKLHQTLGHFVHDRDGNIGILFGLALLPMLAATGAAMDYSRASDARAQLQSAIDSTALAVAKRSPSLTDAQLKLEAEQHFKATLQNRFNLATQPISVQRIGKTLAISASGILPTTFMRLFGVNALSVGSKAEAAISQRQVELALVLDNTGSMSRLSKMDELKKATTNLINAAEASVPAGSGQIKIAIVPFDTEVKIDANQYRTRSWLVFQDEARDRTFDDIRSRLALRAKWTGCITDRGPGFDSNDKPFDITRPQSYQPAVNCASSTLTRVAPLTDNWNALRATTDAMRPSGCTNITIGARFGIAALSPSEPIGGGAPFGTPDIDKYMIILTDGDNTQNRFANGCSGPDSTAQIDTKTKAMCDDIKRKSSRNDASGKPIPDVRIFTIRVIEGNKALLSDCATNASMYKEVNDARDIDAVFKGILQEITRLQLTV